MTETTRNAPRYLIFGGGYLGLRVARLWRDTGGEVTIVTRSPERAALLRGDGYAAHVGDVTGELGDLPPCDVALYAVGYDRNAAVRDTAANPSPASSSPPVSSPPSIEDVYAGGLARVLERLPAKRAPRVIYISTTGVYSQNDGSWVDEHSPCEPTREGGRASLAAERVLQAARGEQGTEAEQPIVLRLAGIYGPGRIPSLEPLRRGDPVATAADGYLNLIHVDDAARAVVNAADSASAAGVYCVSDGDPALRRDYYRYLSELVDAPEPKFVDPDPASHVAARATSDKRVSNRRMRAELMPTLQYPSYREGLRAIVLGVIKGHDFPQFRPPRELRSRYPDSGPALAAVAR